MRLIVAVQWGPARGRRAIVEPGATLRVGRLERAGLVVPHDDALSGLHFELSWDGERCRMRDLGSAGGTFLDGQRVSEGEVGHLHWIRAGNTFFTCAFEGVVAPRADEGEGAGVDPARKAEALAALRAEPEPLFAVLSAARDERVIELLRSAPEESRSLYEGAEGEVLADVAPYLVSLPPGSPLLDRLVDEGWGAGWGIYLACGRPFEEVRRHFRRMLVVEDTRGAALYFRFYDPSVLASARTALKPRHLQQLFGEVTRFWIEGPEGAVVCIPRPAPV